MAKYDNIPGCPGYYISKRGKNALDGLIKKYQSCLTIIVMVLVLWN